MAREGTTLDDINHMIDVWNELKTRGQLIDATLVSSDGKTFPVHKTVLAGCSKYFWALFTTPMTMEDPVVLNDVNSEELENILNWIYRRQLEVTSDNVTKLLHTSSYLSVMAVHQKCIDFLRQSITCRNCLSVLYFARQHLLKSLEESANNFLLRNFQQVAEQSQEVLSMPVEELVPLLSSDLLNVRNEDIVWKFVLRWVDHDRGNRLCHLESLLRCIRLGLMEVQYFLEHVKGHELLKGNAQCRPVIIDTLKVLMDVETITQKDGVVLTPECARPRIPHEVLFAIGGWSGGSPTKAIETYDTRADRWIHVSEEDPAGPRAYHGLAVIGFDIYVIGGFDGMENFNSCRRFDAVTKTWSEIAPMHDRRCYVSVAVVGGIIYAMGGFNGHHRQNSAEKYDPRTNQWTTIAPMTAQRSDASATVLNGKIYVTGGFDGHQCLSSAEVYDPETNTWTLLPPMSCRRSGVSCIAYHDCIYVLGGFNGTVRLTSGEKYVLATKQWMPLPNMYTSRSNFATEVIDDMVFAIGGFNGHATIHQVECYDEATNEWYEATDMNVFRSALSACVVPGLPNLNEYIHQNRHMLMEEKRQKLLALGPGGSSLENSAALTNITEAMELLTIDDMDVQNGNEQHDQDEPEEMNEG